jgi:hypothetical protein
MNTDGTVPLQTDTRPTGAYGDNQRYTERNPPPGQQQSVPTGQYGFNNGPTPAAVSYIPPLFFFVIINILAAVEFYATESRSLWTW